MHFACTYLLSCGVWRAIMLTTQYQGLNVWCNIVRTLTAICLIQIATKFWCKLKYLIVVLEFWNKRNEQLGGVMFPTFNLQKRCFQILFHIGISYEVWSDFLRPQFHYKLNSIMNIFMLLLVGSCCFQLKQGMVNEASWCSGAWCNPVGNDSKTHILRMFV